MSKCQLQICMFGSNDLDDFRAILWLANAGHNIRREREKEKNLKVNTIRPLQQTSHRG